jgi:hypothetical protein
MGSTGGPERLLLSGCASGAWGAIFNIDYAAAWVPATVQIHGLFDAGLSVDIVPMASGLAMPLQEQTLAVLRLTNGTGRLWPPCVSNFPGADVAWKCLFPQYRVPFVKVGYLLAAPQYDSVQLRANEGNVGPPYRPGSTAASYATAFGALSHKVAAALPTHGQNGAAVFAPACYLSCLTVDAAFWTVQPRAGAFAGGARPAVFRALTRMCPSVCARVCRQLSLLPAPTASAPVAATQAISLAQTLRSWHENTHP